MNWKDFFYFSKRERQGILILATFIAGIFIGKWIFSSKEEIIIPDKQEFATISTEQPATEQPFAPPVETRINKSNPTRKKQNKPPEERTYYSIQPKEQASKPQYSKVEKYPEGTVINLNQADTTSLKKVPGIGSAYAKRIVGYRNSLGGYHRLDQLQEVYDMYEELYIKIIPYFSINTDSLRPIPINHSSLEKLRAHPYLNFYQAKAIVETKKKKGQLKSIDELVLLEEFENYNWEKIAPYLSFE